MRKIPDGKDTNVPSKTPEEIKKGLERCKNGAHCDNYLSAYHSQVEADALAYIEQLERERDAAMKDMKKMAYESTDGVVCDLCARKDGVCLDCNFEWHGVKEEKDG